uniref:Uncharacterized protein n=1 Tax=Acrobeloides nanus TaxID=290746 RepID=A0A914E8G7_9BILA
MDRNSETPTVSVTQYYDPSDLSTSSFTIHSNKHSKIHKSRKRKNRHTTRLLNRRSISSAVIETAHCEHPDLLDCDDYVTHAMTCMVTATGMPCCICSGKLKHLKRKRTWSLW